MPLDMKSLQSRSTQPTLLWRELGFLETPVLVSAPTGVFLFRVSTIPFQTNRQPDRLGQFFSLRQPRTRRDAERQLAVMEYGNQIRYLSTYTVRHGTFLWVGRVDPGDFAYHLGNIAGSQVFLEREEEVWLTRMRCDPLPDDLGGKVVVRGSLRTQ